MLNKKAKENDSAKDFSGVTRDNAIDSSNDGGFGCQDNCTDVHVRCLDLNSFIKRNRMIWREGVLPLPI
jgi:hypothetical protein